MYGQLIAVGGGEDIPLLKKTLLIGRRESCDIVLRFANVSAHHCELSLVDGYWYAKDQQSRNGIKVNGNRVTEKRLDPGDLLAVAKHQYKIDYNPSELGALGPPPPDEAPLQETMGKSLLERAGLMKKGVASKALEREVRNFAERESKRYDVLSDRPGQIKDHNKPV